MELLPVFRLPFQWAFLIFIMFSFIGWCSEVVYVGFIHEHRFINRGFLHGPLCPVYGFGGVVILTLPPSLYKTWIPLFLASMLLCTIVEYFVSWKNFFIPAGGIIRNISLISRAEYAF